MRSPVQFGKLKGGELNMDTERDGAFVPVSATTIPPLPSPRTRYRLWNNSYIPYWADAPKNQATLHCM